MNEHLLNQDTLEKVLGHGAVVDKNGTSWSGAHEGFYLTDTFIKKFDLDELGVTHNTDLLRREIVAYQVRASTHPLTGQHIAEVAKWVKNFGPAGGGVYDSIVGAISQNGEFISADQLESEEDAAKAKVD